MRHVELGVFMPVGSNGFLMSKAAPQYQPSFALHREIAQTAEDLGLDYLFSMGKWMGFGGATDFWKETIEPISMAPALAAATSRIKIFATINPLLYKPAVAAKILATIDGISGGRFGINIVTGNTLEEVEQLGVVPEGYTDYRYQYADEWISLIKLLWSQDRTTFEGRFFQVANCVSDPKPVQRPAIQIVSAGLSGEGLAFGVKHSDYQFVGGEPNVMQRLREASAGRDTPLKAATNLMLIFGKTDEEAAAKLDTLIAERDHEALDNLIASFERDNRGSYKVRTDYLRDPRVIGFGNGTPVTGTPKTVAAKLASMITTSGLDAIQFTFIDFVEDLKIFGTESVPELRRLLLDQGVRLSDTLAK
ncbi:LLM class flavin-dependent oxidoreductase [Ketogulonicigenium vulgare]|uniref:Putative monooxygenase YcdM n=1 Tax=Ketogulonicigenium vulgare (strain WSH-001) TaxID=759362 RepID=F9Y806_KETVW|nr:LLM class flavin-dependent oxidoreductase [Ketogulonicigenium vulgare]ADO42945.1 flavin-dependent oxidoreductase, F420-dependent methylene-tetrahydromethanopterin reductase [Ketogulonicigenium vulgare Y25]AEM41132.1 putative monooxygenase YcdM [Ketogulonicigenium vulgare WSH-001]ALJ81271.1 monooxygenase [Ketogulonicigenium vulgare]ANW34010.1 monooxygenase [Ketogulonicigenium vulgare]AOZ54854.1 flavin-dependent oxidoreductase, F420-dependent methylene-tetrahydromethanopterin reductase [Ketog